MPEADLGPDMMRVKMHGVEGECWVAVDQFAVNQYCYAPFGPEARSSVQRIQVALNEVYPRSIEQWEDIFRRDANVEREIAIWLHIAHVYARLTGGQDLTGAEQQDVFRILLGCSTHHPEQVLNAAGLQVLTPIEAEAVISEFFSDEYD
jgi:hypothetical protein